MLKSYIKLNWQYLLLSIFSFVFSIFLIYYSIIFIIDFKNINNIIGKEFGWILLAFPYMFPLTFFIGILGILLFFLGVFYFVIGINLIKKKRNSIIIFLLSIFLFMIIEFTRENELNFFLLKEILLIFLAVISINLILKK